MRKYLIDFSLECLLLIGIILHHRFSDFTIVYSVATKILFCILLVFTLHRTYIDVLSRRVFYSVIVTLGLFFIVIGGAGQVLKSDQLLLLLWRGYCTVKWVTVLSVLVDIQFFHKNRSFEEELLKGTRCLLKSEYYQKDILDNEPTLKKLDSSKAKITPKLND